MDNVQAIKLVRAIRAHAGLELEDIRQAGTHGADSGWAGFTYYSDTCAFYDANEELIWDILSDEADDLGADNVVAFIGGFGGATNVASLAQFKNLLATYALESAGHWLIDRQDARAEA